MKVPATDVIGTVVQNFRVEVERGRLRLFAKATGVTDPIFFDIKAARKAGYPDIVAPPTFLYCLSEDVPNPNVALQLFGLPVADCFHAEQGIELVRPIFAGDRLNGITKIDDYFEKKAGKLKFVVTTTSFADPAGAEVGCLRTTVICADTSQ